MAARCVQCGSRVKHVRPTGKVQPFTVSFQAHNKMKLLRFPNETKFFSKEVNLKRNQTKNSNFSSKQKGISRNF